MSIVDLVFIYKNWPIETKYVEKGIIIEDVDSWRRGTRGSVI